MKNSNTNKIGSAQRFTHRAAVLTLAASLLLVGLFTACPNAAGGGGTSSGGNTGGGSTPTPPPVTKYKVTFAVEGSPPNGTLTATVDNAPINSGAMVEEGKELTFTAEPASGYMVESWTGITAPIPNATEVKHTLTADVTVQVTFKPLPSELFTVTVQAGGHGTLLVNPALLAGNKAPKDVILTFTATPEDGYVVDKWTLSAGSFESGGTDGSTTATVKVTADITVSVSFKLLYTPVDYDGLENYLANTASSTEINYIEVTGTIPRNDFQDAWGPGALGQKIKSAAPKKVALKLHAEVAGLTGMSEKVNTSTVPKAPKFIIKQLLLKLLFAYIQKEDILLH